jgi:hypothetical protein
MVVIARIPNVAMLIKADAIPQHLLEVAMRDAMGQPLVPSQNGEAAEGEPEPTLSTELMKQAVELQEWLVTQMVIEPALEVEDLEELPQEDVDMLVAIAQRNRFRDAAGVRLGVMPLDEAERFRHWHKCADGCPACQAWQQEFSSIDVGEL